MGAYISTTTNGDVKEDVETIILDALVHKWTIDAKNGNTITPPSEFVCRGWGQRWRPAHSRGIEVLIPECIFEETVRRTGTR